MKQSEKTAFDETMVDSDTSGRCPLPNRTQEQCVCWWTVKTPDKTSINRREKIIQHIVCKLPLLPIRSAREAPIIVHIASLSSPMQKVIESVASSINYGTSQRWRQTVGLCITTHIHCGNVKRHGVPDGELQTSRNFKKCLKKWWWEC